VIEWYRHTIIEQGRQPLFLMFLAFVLTFLFIRFSVRMIRAGVRWWPGNVSPGGLHVHHVVFGVVFILIGGAGGFSRIAGSAPWAEVFPALFGCGAALVLDEFALILHLDDVYWSEEGRKSVEVVVLTAALVGLMLVGFSPFGVNDMSQDELQDRGSVISTVVINFLFSLAVLSKGKTRMAIFSVIVPLIGLIGLVRLARPGSAWARRFYRRRPRARAKSTLRAYRHDRRWSGPRRRLQDLLGGKPDALPDRAP
jgi:hypothetical protein